MMSFPFPKSIRKFLRREKVRIRRAAFGRAEAEKKIAELVADVKEQYNKGKKKGVAWR